MNWLVLACVYFTFVPHSTDAKAAGTEVFSVINDVPQQRQALLQILQTVGHHADIGLSGFDLADLGYSGNHPWGASNISYCWWWGISCCDRTSEPKLCRHGLKSGNSVNSIRLPAMGLQGTLPDVFSSLPDLQMLDVSFNRGLKGPLPDSLGTLSMLSFLAVEGTQMRCNATAREPPACPLPDWLQQDTSTYEHDRSGYGCPAITFTRTRAHADLLANLHRGTSAPQVVLNEMYHSDHGSKAAAADQPDHLDEIAAKGGLGQVPLVAILLPCLTVFVGLVLLSAALTRYLRYLKRGHDAIHLTEAWKRRNPPGLITIGDDRVLREVTLVMTDVEGSTELWEADYAVMTLAQEVHDSVMRSLIGQFCGYEVATEGDSFTIAFHDAFDAVSWSLAMQQAMLEADWPEALLTMDKGSVVYSTAQDSSTPGQLLFRGLRVRVAISTGVPAMIQTHELTNTLLYSGPVMDMVVAMSDLPYGGQILLSPLTFSSIASRLAELGTKLLHVEGHQAQQPTSKEPMQSGDKPHITKFLRLWQQGGAGPQSMALPAENERSGNACDHELLRFCNPKRRCIGIVATASCRLRTAPAVTADTVQDNDHIPMVVDLGSHLLDGLGHAAVSGVPTSTSQGVRLTQIIARRLAARVAHFSSPLSTQQVTPSYFEAPEAHQALLPDGLKFSTGRLPVVTLAFCAPDGMKSLEGQSRAAKQALEMFCSTVRTTLNACRGYECQEKDGIFMLAFQDPATAVEWACALNLALLFVHWAPEVLASHYGREVYGPDGLLVYRGIKARVGIYKGEITRIIPHRATGRADYFGPPVNRAARFLSAAAPGQILVERSLVEEVLCRLSNSDQQANLLERAMRCSSCASGILSRRHSNIAAGTAVSAVAEVYQTSASTAISTASPLQQDLFWIERSGAPSAPPSLTAASSLTTSEAAGLNAASLPMQPSDSMGHDSSSARSEERHKTLAAAAAAAAAAVATGTLATLPALPTAVTAPWMGSVKSFSGSLPTLFETGTLSEQQQVPDKQLSRAGSYQTTQPQQQQRCHLALDLQAAAEPNIGLRSPLQSPFAGLASSCNATSSNELHVCNTGSHSGVLLTSASTAYAKVSRSGTNALDAVDAMRALPQAEDLYAGFNDAGSLDSSSDDEDDLEDTAVTGPHSRPSMPSLATSKLRGLMSRSNTLLQQALPFAASAQHTLSKELSAAGSIKPSGIGRQSISRLGSSFVAGAAHHRQSWNGDGTAGESGAHNAAGLGGTTGYQHWSQTGDGTTGDTGGESLGRDSTVAGDYQSQMSDGTGGDRALGNTTTNHASVKATAQLSQWQSSQGYGMTAGVRRALPSAFDNSSKQPQQQLTIARRMCSSSLDASMSPVLNNVLYTGPSPLGCFEIEPLQATAETVGGTAARSLQSKRHGGGCSRQQQKYGPCARHLSRGPSLARAMTRMGSVAMPRMESLVAPLVPSAAVASAVAVHQLVETAPREELVLISSPSQQQREYSHVAQHAAKVLDPQQGKAAAAAAELQHKCVPGTAAVVPSAPAVAADAAIAVDAAAVITTKSFKGVRERDLIHGLPDEESEGTAGSVTTATSAADAAVADDDDVDSCFSNAQRHAMYGMDSIRQTAHLETALGQTPGQQNVQITADPPAAAAGQKASTLLSTARWSDSQQQPASKNTIQDTLGTGSSGCAGVVLSTPAAAAAIVGNANCGFGSAFAAASVAAGSCVEGLSGAVPVDALSGLRLNRRQSSVLQALKNQVQSSAIPTRVPLQIQVYDKGTWSFKGISGSHQVVLVLPTRLAARHDMAASKRSSKAICLQPADDLLQELWMDVVNLDSILLDPQQLLMQRGSEVGKGYCSQ